MLISSIKRSANFWRNTSIASLAPGQSATITAGCSCIIGFEWDTDQDNGFRPAGLFGVSSSTYNVAGVLQAAGLATVVSEATQQASRVAGDGVVAVREAVVGMDTIRQRVQSIAENILALSEQSQQIGEIITTVNDLADQSLIVLRNRGGRF